MAGLGQLLRKQQDKRDVRRLGCCVVARILGMNVSPPFRAGFDELAVALEEAIE